MHKYIFALKHQCQSKISDNKINPLENPEYINMSKCNISKYNINKLQTSKATIAPSTRELKIAHKILLMASTNTEPKDVNARAQNKCI